MEQKLILEEFKKLVDESWKTYSSEAGAAEENKKHIIMLLKS